MLRLKQRSITAKMIMVIAGFAVLTCCLIGVGAYGIRTNDKTVQSVLDTQAKALFLASASQERASEMHQRAFEVLVETDPSQWAGLQQAVTDRLEGLRKTLTEMRPVLDEGDLDLYATLKPDVDLYQAAELRAYGLQNDGKRSAAEDQLQGEVKQIFARLNAHLETLVSQQIRDMNEARDEISGTSNKTLVGMILTGVVGLIVTMAGALLLVRWQISRPIGAMTQAMTRLAAGDTTIVIPARGQKDEIGAMAAAVQTFKDAAIAKVDLERDAVETRHAADAARARNEDERATVADQQAQVVQGLAAGLEHLSDGDLMFRLEQPFAAGYETLRVTFNAAIAKLQDTMVVIAGSTSALRSGTAEISTAADDLSRRTEQQAASLEEPPRRSTKSPRRCARRRAARNRPMRSFPRPERMRSTRARWSGARSQP